MRTKQIPLAAMGAILTASLSFGQQYPQPQQQNPSNQYPQGQYPPAQGYPQQQYPAGNYSQPPTVPPDQLDQMVASIALYPDGLLAHVLTAATFPDQIPEAAGWANQHAYLRGGQLADAIRRDNLPWDISVLALLPFPQVLSQMAQYMQWTEQLGNAVLVERGEVMDSVQRLRARANQYGYFRDPQFDRYERVEVRGPGLIDIEPLSDDYYVPYYSPRIFFERPRAGIYGIFSFGPAISVGATFAPWGWGGVGFGWREHNILIDRRPWEREWRNRAEYQHPYVQPYRHDAAPRVEQHEYRPDQRFENRGHDEHRGHEEHGHGDHRDHDHR
jgi:hypothetical protein